MNAPSQKNDGMGSLYYSGDGTARFRVWAPFAAQIDVILDHPVANTTFALANEAGTPNWSADGIPAPPNTRYQYRITAAPGQDNDTSQPHIRTDARALQVEGSDAACQGYIVDPGLFNADGTPFTTPAFEDFLIYQLHVGSFTCRNDGVANPYPTSTFVDLKNRLPYIRKLGFNAIELLPISNFQADTAGGAGEGYGPSDMFASENLYSTAANQAVSELIQLIDAAHSLGLAVILDVIYNHAGQLNNRYWQYDGNCSGDNGIPGGIYHVHGHHTPWGEGFATWQREVKGFLLDNARMYLRDFGVDGLRFDAVQAIVGDDLGAPMQRMVTDVNNLRWNHPALRSPAGEITHTDFTNNVVAFKRWNNAGDVLLIVVNASDGQWDNTQYAVGLDGDTGTWREIFNSQAPLYGGVNTVGNLGYALGATNGQLWISLASWSVHMFAKG